MENAGKRGQQLIGQGLASSCCFVDITALCIVAAPVTRRRMQNMRTHKYVRCFIVFMSTFIVRHNPTMLAAAMDSVQPGVFLMVLQQVRS
jgi:hypothetical protein